MILILTFLITFSILLFYCFNLNFSNVYFFLKKKINFENIVKFLTFLFVTFFLFFIKFKVFADTENLSSNDFCQKSNESLLNFKELLKNKPEISEKEYLIEHILQFNTQRRLFEDYMAFLGDDYGAVDILDQLYKYFEKTDSLNLLGVQDRKDLEVCTVKDLQEVFDTEKQILSHYFQASLKLEKRMNIIEKKNKKK